MSTVYLNPTEPKALAKCDGCGHQFPAEEALPVADFQDRCAPGEIVPVGECPKCGSCAHYAEPPSWARGDDYAEDAMILWEGVIDWMACGRALPEAYAYRENYGTAELRTDVLALVPRVRRAWEHVRIGSGAPKEFDESFDWEFVPWFIASCVDWDPSTGPGMKPDWWQAVEELGGYPRPRKWRVPVVVHASAPAYFEVEANTAEDAACMAHLMHAVDAQPAAAFKPHSMAVNAAEVAEC